MSYSPYLNFFPNISLLDETNTRCEFHDLIRDKTVIINMFYSNCKLRCIPLGKLFANVNRLLTDFIEPENIHFISITLDAINDTAEDLNRFKMDVGTDGCKNWHFYTGNPQEIEVLKHKLGMASPILEVERDISKHAGHFIIINEKMNNVKHADDFDNPVDIARKLISHTTNNFPTHCGAKYVSDFNFEALTDEDIFENIHSMSTVFTVPFLPPHIKLKFGAFATKQRGFNYDPLDKILGIDGKSSSTVETISKKCCCKG